MSSLPHCPTSQLPLNTKRTVHVSRPGGFRGHISIPITSTLPGAVHHGDSDLTLTSTMRSSMFAFIVLTITITTASAHLFARQLGSIPACASTCIQNTSPGSCSPSDEQCLCTSSTYVNALGTCIHTSCSTADIAAAESALKAICAGVSTSPSTSTLPVTTTVPPAPITTATVVSSSASLPATVSISWSASDTSAVSSAVNTFNATSSAATSESAISSSSQSESSSSSSSSLSSASTFTVTPSSSTVSSDVSRSSTAKISTHAPTTSTVTTVQPTSTDSSASSVLVDGFVVLAAVGAVMVVL
ncbi:hypothetical protein C8Q72DRAFT_134773 [Fomitopsis betulina]|nr:hypothetical protein C8Q72DRAFT_134773 [Fomitopsis betulina]